MRPVRARLAELAEAMERLAYGGRGGPHIDRIFEICTLVEGRGACRHPDGVARFVRTGRRFADEVTSHQRRARAPRRRPRGCSQCRAERRREGW